MNQPDELELNDLAKIGDRRNSEDSDLAKRIGRLVRERPYGVLCTQSQSQPYGSLVALAATDDLTAFVFSIPIATRKYRLLSECDHVALVIDSRSGAPAELMQVESVTATGRARVVPPGPEFEQWAGLLIRRHPHLSAFVRAESTALFRVEVVRYFHVCRFQEVRQTAIFDPLGLFGLIYWYALYPLHHLMFAGMLKALARAAEKERGHRLEQ